jgi:uncharacterized cofD-like protein
MKKKIVSIGGGNGTAATIRALKKNFEQFEISAVVSTADSAGSSGKLREEFDIPPPGDILRAILAMSPYGYRMLKPIFYKNRFTTKELAGHNLGNLFLTLVTKYQGSLVESIRALEVAVAAYGHVYPVTLKGGHLHVELTNGEVVKGESNIDRPNYDRKHKISKAWLEPEVVAYQNAKEVIENADCVILSPGSLYTSLVATLLPQGIKQAIAKSSARIIYIPGDSYELKGETGPEKLSDFVKTLEQYLPRKIDMVIYNNHKLDELQKKRYAERDWGGFEMDIDNLPDHYVVGADYESGTGGLSPVKLGEILRRAINGEALN